MTAAALELLGSIVLDGARTEDACLRLDVDGVVLFAGAATLAPRLEVERRIVLQPEATVLPGLVDLHLHGGGGADAIDAEPEALATLREVHLRHGTVALCPSLLAAEPAQLLRALEVVRAATGDGGPGAAVLGAHLEGPFLSPRRAGAQPAEHLRAPDRVLLEELCAAAGPALRVVTLAPELPGALALVELLRERGVTVALGHSDASYEQAIAAVEAGARLVTHTWNAMGPLHHREPGLVGAALLDERLTVEAIADGVHLAPPILRLLRRLKSPDRLALVSDCTAALEAPPGGARLGVQPVAVRGGSARLPDGTLAGSVLTMDRSLATFVAATGASLAEASLCATRTPCALLGETARGGLEPGQRGDVVVVDGTAALRAVLVRGRLVAGELEELTA